MAGKIENGQEIDFKKLFGDRPGALIVEAPSGAAGEKAPAECTRGSDRRCAADSAASGSMAPSRRRPSRSGGRAGAQPALGLHHREAKLVAFALLGEVVSPVLCCFVREQQAVRHILSAICAQVLLSQAHRPPRAVRGRARSDHPRSGFRWAMRRARNRSQIAPSAASRSSIDPSSSSCQSGNSVMAAQMKSLAKRLP